MEFIFVSKPQGKSCVFECMLDVSYYFPPGFQEFTHFHTADSIGAHTAPKQTDDPVAASQDGE